MHFEQFIRPRSVAIIGASPQRGSPRNTLVRNLQRHGFAGRVYPVSQSHAEIEGLKAYRSVAELPEPADVALIITPASTVPALVAECGSAGIRNAIVFSAGFEEVEGGREIARRMADAARHHDVAVLGPNCQGVWSVRHGAMLTFSGVPMNNDTMLHAPIAIVSQSGALAGAIGNALLKSGIGCSYVISVGNETCLDALDLLECVIEQDDVKVAALYIEGLDDAARLLPIARRARARGIQIVALKAGRSAVGQQATASHTGKIASPHAIYTHVMEQAGVIALDSLQEVIAAVEVLAYIGHPRRCDDPKAGISVMSASGGAGALLADYSSAFGLSMAEFGPLTVQRLKQVLPEFARQANPIDLTGQVNTDRDLFKNTCEAVTADPRTEAVVVQFSSSGRRYIQENGEAFKAMGRQGVPVVISFIGESMENEVRKEFRESGVLLATDPLASMRALLLLYRRQRAFALPMAVIREDLPMRAAPQGWADTMRFLEDSAVTPARWVVLEPDDQAATACANLRYPVAVKVLPSESAHKTELGLVRLRVPNPQVVDDIARELRERLGKPGAGILVQEMVGDGVEVVMSCMRQTDFGPVLSIGTGGVAIELYQDIVNMALPVSKEQVLSALKGLKLYTLLQGFRGKPAADMDALAAAAVRFGDMFLACPQALEFEVNPVIVGPKGQGLSAVDALLTVSSR